MIQRIQSVFLFVSLCFLVSMFFIPVATLVHSRGIVTFDFVGFDVSALEEPKNIQYSIMLFAILISFINLIIIFLYKSRLLQMRLCVYNILLLIGIAGVSLLVIYSLPDVEQVTPNLPIVFPVVSAILHYLAFRAIRRDHFMVEALNRLR